MSDNRNDHANQPDYLPMQASRRGEENERRVNQALDRHTGNVIPVIFSRKERALVQGHLMAELSLGFGHRRKALNMVLETRLHFIREACNHVLVTGKTQLRQQHLEYFGEVYRNVEQRMNQLANDFLVEMDARFERSGKFANERIRERENKRLEKSLDNFLDTLDQLMDEFRSIIDENIDHNRSAV